MVSELGKVAGAGVIASYGRDQERQADTIGQDLAAAAGWDPEGIADFLATLEREGQLRTGKSRQPTFLDSHPMPGERSVTTRERAPTLPRGAAPRIAKGRTAYLKKVEGLMVGPDPAEGGFEGGRFVHPGLGFSIEFPRGWATQNQKQMVGAISKRRDAVTLLELAGPTGDPRAAAQRWAQSNRVRVARSGALSIGGYAAHRVLAEAQSQQGVVAADVFFIAHPKGTFRLTNLASMQGHDAWAPTFERTAASFRSITQAERNRARPLRLRLATARAGETLVTLGKRSGNAWSAQETAVQNQIDQATPLRAGQIVKVAVRQ
jgi:predicted Zn-dependent protease